MCHLPAGLWLAPQMVGEALKGGRLAAEVLSREGFNVIPAPGRANPWSFITGERGGRGSLGGWGSAAVRWALEGRALLRSSRFSLTSLLAMPRTNAPLSTLQLGSTGHRSHLQLCGVANHPAPALCHRSRGAGQQGSHGGLLPRGAAVLPHRLVHPAGAR